VDDRLADPVAPAGRSELYTALLRQAGALFSVRGYRATSTRDIAERAGASEALLFRHFGTKQQLFRQAILDPFGLAMDGLPAELSSGGGEPIPALIGRLYRFMAEHRTLFRSLIATSGIGDGPAIELARHGSPLRGLFELVEQRLVAAAGEPAGALDPPNTARVVVALVLASSVLDDWLFVGLAAPPSRDRVVAELDALVLFGCTGRPGATPSSRPTPAIPDPAPQDPATPNPAPERSGREPRPRPRERTKNRQRRSRYEVRHAVLVAARELFSAQGYPGTTTQQIATRAHVSETSLYRHYANKRTLFEQAIFEPFEQWVTSYLSAWSQSDRSPASLEQQSRSYVTNSYDMLAGSRGLIRSLIATGVQEPHRSPIEDSPLREIFPRLEGQLADLAAANGLTGLDIEVTIRATFGMILVLATMPDWMFDGPGSEPPRDRLIAEMAAVMTFGITGREVAAPQGAS
jgi:AcrR family transcriptional regulator